MEDGAQDSIRVLHVDDESSFLELTAEFLQREDESLDVESATGASEALDKFCEEYFDCIVSDFDMPKMDGIDLLKAVRADYPDFPFILFTGKGDEEIASQAISAGVDDYLQKQSGTEQYTLLTNRIKNAVEKYRSSREAARTKRFFSSLIEHTTDVIPVIAPDGRLKYVSPSCNWHLGYDQDDVIGDNAFDYIHPEDLDRAAEKFQETIEQPDQMPEVKFRFKHADGSWVRLHGRAKNLLDDPDVEGIVSYNRIVEE